MIDQAQQPARAPVMADQAHNKALSTGQTDRVAGAEQVVEPALAVVAGAEEAAAAATDALDELLQPLTDVLSPQGIDAFLATTKQFENAGVAGVKVGSDGTRRVKSELPMLRQDLACAIVETYIRPYAFDKSVLPPKDDSRAVCDFLSLLLTIRRRNELK